MVDEQTFYRPKGKELELLNKFKKLEALTFHHNEICTPSVPCVHGHALEAVRINGSQHLATLCTYIYRWKNEIKENEKLRKKWESKNKKILALFAGLNAQVDKYFIVCLKCKGKGGAKDPRCGSANGWEDCYQCNGRGLIKKKGI